MNETFGTRLRLQRERQQVDLTAIAASTKINVSLLERLERDDVEHWPTGIFRRAYVRSYAAAIGLDPEAVLREFLELYGDPKPSDPFSVAEAEETGGRPTTRLGQMVRSALAAMPGFRQRPARPELSTVNLALESADDREMWGHEEPFEPEPAPAPAIVPHRYDDSLDDGAILAHGVPDDPANVAAEGSASGAAMADRMAEREAGHRQRVPDEGRREPAMVADSRFAHGAALAPWRREPDLVTAAALCTRFAQVREWTDVDALLGEAARAIDAIGLVVWSHVAHADALVAVLAHGYSPALLARMPAVPRSADNAIAAAFQSTRRCIVSSDDGRPGALVVPLLAAAGCAGVLAFEFAGGAERSDRIAAFAEIVAAQLAPLVGATPAAEAVSA